MPRNPPVLCNTLMPIADISPCSSQVRPSQISQSKLTALSQISQPNPPSKLTVDSLITVLFVCLFFAVFFAQVPIPVGSNASGVALTSPSSAAGGGGGLGTDGVTAEKKPGMLSRILGRGGSGKDLDPVKAQQQAELERQRLQEQAADASSNLSAATALQNVRKGGAAKTTNPCSFLGPYLTIFLPLTYILQPLPLFSSHRYHRPQRDLYPCYILTLTSTQQPFLVPQVQQTSTRHLVHWLATSN